MFINKHSLIIIFYLVSFKIFDFDGDNFVSVGDLTAIVAASLRERGLVISRPDIDFIVKKTFDDVKPKNEGMITFDEYDNIYLFFMYWNTCHLSSAFFLFFVSCRYKKVVGNNQHLAGMYVCQDICIYMYVYLSGFAS